MRNVYAASKSILVFFVSIAHRWQKKKGNVWQRIVKRKKW